MKHDMFCTSALFPKTDDGHFNMDYFLNRHVPMLEELLKETGLVRIEVKEGVTTAPPGPAVAYVVLASLVFNTLEALETAMVTHGAQIRADMPDFTNITPQIQVNQLWVDFTEQLENAQKGARR